MGEFGFSNSTEINNKIKSGEPEYYNLIFKEFMDTAFVAGVSGVMFWGWGFLKKKLCLCGGAKKATV